MDKNSGKRTRTRRRSRRKIFNKRYTGHIQYEFILKHSKQSCWHCVIIIDNNKHYDDSKRTTAIHHESRILQPKIYYILSSSSPSSSSCVCHFSSVSMHQCERTFSHISYHIQMRIANSNGNGTLKWKKENGISFQQIAKHMTTLNNNTTTDQQTDCK